MKLQDLAAFDSTLKLQLNTDCDFEIKSISHSDDPQPQTFCFIKNQKFLSSIGRRSSSEMFKDAGVVVEESFFNQLDDISKAKLSETFSFVATVSDVSTAMCTLSKPFYDRRFQEYNFQVDGRKMGTAEVDPTARVSEGVFIGENVIVGANVIIMNGCTILPNSSIEEGTVLFPNVTIYPEVTIGRNCRIHSGTVIGSDGFGYNFSQGEHKKIWHLCGVEVGDNVEIGANTMIDCGAFISTKIGDGTKIDNCVQIAHNAQIGKHNIFCGMSGMGGSSEIGDYNVFAAGAGVAHNVKLGSGVQLAAKAVVSENSEIFEKVTLAGHPARPLKEWLRSKATLRRLSKR